MVRRWILVALAAGGCFVDTPSGGSETAATSTGEGSSSSSSSSTTAMTTSSSSSGTESGTTDDATTSTTSTTSTTTTTSAETSATTDPLTTSTTDVGTSSTTAVSTSSTTAVDLPNPLELAPDIATCVFLATEMAPYGPPDECITAVTKWNGTEAIGVMAVDLVTLYAADRPAWSLLRFTIPPEVANYTIVDATLTLTVADGNTAHGPAGDLYLVAPFTPADLLFGEPEPLSLLDKSPGEVVENQKSPRPVDPMVIEPGQPLFLGVLPAGTNGTQYQGLDIDPSRWPKLTLTLQ